MSPQAIEVVNKFFAFLGYVPVSTLAAPATTEAVAAEPAVNRRDADKAALVKALSREKYKWRSLDRLCNILKTDDENYVQELLVEVGARSDYYDQTNFGLKSRVGESGRRRSYC